MGEMVRSCPSLQEICAATVADSDEKKGFGSGPPIRSGEAACYPLMLLAYSSDPMRPLVV